MGVLMNLHAQGNYQQIAGDGSETHFMLGNNADIFELDGDNTIKIYVAGTLKTVTTDYTISGYVVTVTSAPAAGALIQGEHATFDRG